MANEHERILALEEALTEVRTRRMEHEAVFRAIFDMCKEANFWCDFAGDAAKGDVAKRAQLAVETLVEAHNDRRDESIKAKERSAELMEELRKLNAARPRKRK